MRAKGEGPRIRRVPSSHEHRETRPRGRTDFRDELRRERTGAEVVYGLHTVLAALREGKTTFERVLLAKDRHDSRAGEIRSLARERKVPVQFVPVPALDRLSHEGSHQGVVGILSARAYGSLDDVLETAGNSAILVLADGVQDPGNLGAIVRTAAAAGASAVVIPAHGACGLTPVVAKAAAGALERIPVLREGNIAALIPRLQEIGFRAIGMDLRAEKLWNRPEYSGRIALVLGGEEGLRKLVRARCDELVRLPVAEGIDSLNVSVATGVALYEIVRQRQEAAEGSKGGDKG